MKLRLACRPGMQRGPWGSERAQAPPDLPRAHGEQSRGLGLGGALGLLRAPGLGPTLPPPSLIGHFSSFSGSFPRGTREKALGRFPGGPSWFLPEMVWLLGELGE